MVGPNVFASLRPPHTAQSQTNSQLPYPTTLLPLVWPVRQKSCIETHCFDMLPAFFTFDQNETTISDKNSCILNMQRGITKRAHFQRNWTHQTYLLSTLSESPQALQTSSGCAGVFLPLMTTTLWLSPTILMKCFDKLVFQHNKYKKTSLPVWIFISMLSEPANSFMFKPYNKFTL